MKESNQENINTQLLPADESPPKKLSRWHWAGILATVAVNIAIIVAYAVVMETIDQALQDANQICDKNSPLADTVTHPDPQLTQNFFFNVTNPIDVVNGATAILHEIGPFTYRTKNQRGNVQYDKKEDTVSVEEWF